MVTDLPRLIEDTWAHAPPGREVAYCNELITDFAAGTGVEDVDLQPDGASSRFHVSQRGFGIGRTYQNESGGFSESTPCLNAAQQAMRNHEGYDMAALAPRGGRSARPMRPFPAGPTRMVINRSAALRAGGIPRPDGSR